MPSPSISVIVTAYNEGEELGRTLRSVIGNTRHLAEVIVVDDGSDDGFCQTIATELVRVLRHDRRTGVAYSRDEASRAARGDVLCYLDAHQRLSRGCLDRCAELAIARGAIVCPDVRDFGLFRWRLHGAEFRLCPKRGYFTARWRAWFTLPGVSEISGLRAPPYLLPRSLYPRLAWSQMLRGWGGSESAIAVKSFFTGIKIFHIAGPVARHRFRSQFPYTTTWDEVWRNQAIIARVCFDDATWTRYWLPRVFDPHLTDEMRAELEGEEIQQEHQDFLEKKVRTDQQFWTELLHRSTPSGI